MASNPKSTGSSCPVDHASRGSEARTCPIDHTPASQTKTPAEERPVCPVDHSTSRRVLLPDPHLDPRNQMPVIPEQSTSADQSGQLSTTRTVSSIPRADRYQAAGPSECPALHEESTTASTKSSDMWVYPSEQMFFNAMKRKNWNPEIHDMKTVVPIHNAVNERCWNHILEWEAMHENSCGGPRLLKFEGKAKELTPKARVRLWLGYQRPFDRHDWTVDRCGKPVRYVIDFYEGRKDSHNPLAPSFYLDVRPALTLEGAWDRVRKLVGV
ncbi:Cytochrome c1 heme lyase [Coemansia sp. BCRC 34301]|nr:Cytochrome c1 heme lyase [Coemansia sp. BCRC 34301]